MMEHICPECGTVAVTCWDCKDKALEVLEQACDEARALAKRTFNALYERHIALPGEAIADFDYFIHIGLDGLSQAEREHPWLKETE